ncbi:hydrogenase expression/formation protein HypE [bacterium]|nr:hydrogenase expression/formation protein HypE [bacterium]
MSERDDILNALLNSCPIPITDYKEIVLGHGSGGRLTHQLIERMLLPQFRNDLLEPLHDGAIFSLNGSRLAFTTDSYVVNPIFFPGGNIGHLAINGTVNDLSMCGAKPLYLSVAFILEEGFPMEELWRIVLSMKQAAEAAGVALVTGDTKVVDRGKGDKIFINTSGVGIVENGVNIHPNQVKVGDQILINGAIAAHGIAILAVRENLEFESPIVSDSAPLNHLVQEMLNASHEIHVLRDPTRGGLASTFNEIAKQVNVGISLKDNQIPIAEATKGACEILGLDPLYVANEGKLIAFVAPEHSERVLSAMRNHPLGKESAVIGEVVQNHPGTVVLKTRIGGSRVVDMLSGEQLPRIC